MDINAHIRTSLENQSENLKRYRSQVLEAVYRIVCNVVELSVIILSIQTAVRIAETYYSSCYEMLYVGRSSNWMFVVYATRRSLFCTINDLRCK